MKSRAHRSRSRERAIDSEEEYYRELERETQQAQNRKYKREKKEESKREKPQEKEQPNWNPSGLLGRQTNTVNNQVLKFSEPQDSAMPTSYWRLVPFQKENELKHLHIHRSTSFLIGRKGGKIADIQIDHITISKQHAVIQYRQKYTHTLQESTKAVLPYIMDLESRNGTKINGEQIEAARYYELKETDLLQFGECPIDYVVMRGSEISKQN